MNTQATLHQLTDEQLTKRLIAWRGREQKAQAAVIAHLVEVERRELHLLQGYPSLFAFCTEALGMTEDVAGTRIGAVRVARDFPCVLEMLADGRLSLSSIRLLRPHLRQENAVDLLQAAAGLSKRELEKLLACRFPKPDVSPRVRKLPHRHGAHQMTAVPADEPATADAHQDSLEHAPQGETPSLLSATPGPHPPQSPAPAVRSEQRHNQVSPLSATRYKVTFTASEEIPGGTSIKRARAAAFNSERAAVRPTVEPRNM